VEQVITEDVLNGFLKELIVYHSLDEAMRFLHEGYLVTQEYINMRGHSCSYHQLYWDEAHTSPNFEKLESVQQESEEVVMEHIQVYTKSIQDRVEKIVLERDQNRLHNGYLVMMQSGTKANLATLTQMMGVVGQTYLTHERIPNVTSHFAPGDKSLIAHGFIRHPYALGLSFHDLMTQAQPTTESVINKIKGTSQSGYLQKKMAYCTMGMVADTYGHAIDSYSGHRRQHAFHRPDIQKPGPTIWQHYGGDALDPQYLVWETITPPTTQHWPDHHLGDLGIISASVGDSHVSASISSFYSTSWTLWDKIKHQDLKFKSPFHIKRLFQQASALGGYEDLTEDEIITSFMYIWNRMVAQRIVPEQHYKMQVLLRVWCCPYNVKIWKLSSVGWYSVLKNIYHGIRRRNIIPGEAIGMNATHCVGEVHTQSILKSPHTSGKKNAQVTGCGRLTHLMDANNSLSTMTIYFLPGVTEAQVHYTAMTWRTVYLSEVLSDYPKVDESSMTIRLSLDTSKKSYYLVQDYHIMLALYHGMQLPFSSIHRVNATLIVLRMTPGIKIWNFALKQAGTRQATKSNKTLCALQGIAYNIFHQTIVRGKVDGITKYIIEKQTNNQWVCITDQSDFSVWKNHPLVDKLQSYSSNTVDTQKFMGVYATTQVLTHEFVTLMAGTSTDARHLELMARYMTMTGVHEGFKKNEVAKRIAPMQQASFEESSKHVMENCDMGRWDPGNTVAAAAICNKNMNLGTGYLFEMLQDVIPYRKPYSTFTPQKHVMVPHLNGSRALLLFTTYKNCIQLFIITHKKKIHKLKRMPSKLPIPLFAGTVLDGEFLSNPSCFAITDCYMMCGNTCKHLRYDQRWELAVQALQLISTSQTAKKHTINVSPCVIKSSLYPYLYNVIVSHSELPFGLHVKPMVELKDIEPFSYALPFEALDLFDTASEVNMSKSNVKHAALRLHSNRIVCYVDFRMDNEEQWPWPRGTPSLFEFYRTRQGNVVLRSAEGYIISAAHYQLLSTKSDSVTLSPGVVTCMYQDHQWKIIGPSSSPPFSWNDIMNTIVAIAETIQPSELHAQDSQ
jgi:hypothetical protein